MQTPSATTAARSNGLHIALWVVQVLLAVAFGFASFMKLTMPIAELSKNIPWTAAVPAALVRFIGACEGAAAVGLILPAVTRIRPALTPLAAAGLVLVMALALPFHIARGEAAEALPVNLLLGGLAAFVVWGRFRKAPINATGPA